MGAVLALAITPASATEGTIRTIAGGGAGDGAPALTVGIWLSPYEKSAIGPDGLYYFAQSNTNRIRRLNADGTIVTVAGNGNMGFAGDDGPAVSAQLSTPTGIAFSPSGDLYIADSQNHRIRKVDSAGVISTVAGNGGSTYGGDGGPALAAGLVWPTDIEFDAGGRLYIIDVSPRRVRRINTAGIIETVAGNGQVGGPYEGPATSVSLVGPADLAVEADGGFFVADSSRIVHVDTSGALTRVAGRPDAQGSAGDDGPARNALLTGPRGLSLDGLGNLYVCDPPAHRVRVIDANGIIKAFAGDGFQRDAGDGGPALAASFAFPGDVEALASGVIVSDAGASRIRKVGADGIIRSIAGTGDYRHLGDGYAAVQAGLTHPAGVAADSEGNVYVADLLDHRVRKVSPSGTISTVAGTGLYGYSGDGGSASQARLYNPTSVAVDGSGDLLIADTGNNRIRKVGRDGVITTIAGGAKIGSPWLVGDGGPATLAYLSWPRDVAVGPDGSIFIADSSNNRIRRIDESGIISTVAGGGVLTPADGTPATLAEIHSPDGMALDGAGRIFFVEHTMYGMVRVVDADGTLRTLAGTGRYGPLGDGGPATSATFRYPTDLLLDSDGSLLVADTENHRIRRIGNDGIMTTFAGNAAGYAGDGMDLSAAQFRYPSALCFGASGSLLIADSGNGRIRRAGP